MEGNKKWSKFTIALSVAVVIGFGGWIWSAFFQPMVKTPTNRLDIAEAEILKKLDKGEYEKQHILTQAQIDKKLEKEQYYAAHNSLKDFIAKQNELLIGQVKGEVHELRVDVKTVLNMHLKDGSNK